MPANRPPRFRDNDFDIDEGASQGTVVAYGDDYAFDKDPLTFGLDDDAGGLFEIDENSGDITYIGTDPLDYESQTSYTLTVSIDDGTYTTTEDVFISVNDIDDNPFAPPTAGLDSASDTGESYTDGITNDLSPTITGDAEPESLVRIYRVGETDPIAEVITAKNGTWEADISAVEGDNELVVVTVNPLGIESDPTPLNFFVDSSLSQTTTVLLANETGDPDGFTADPILELTGTAEPDAIVEIYDGNKLLGTTTVAGDGSWSVTTPELRDNSYNLEVVTRDIAGNIDTTQLEVTVDTSNEAPVVASPVTAEETEDASGFNVNLLEGATDPNGDVLTVTNLALVSGDASGVSINGNSLDVTPSTYNDLAAGDSEVIEYSYDIIDGNGGLVSQTATITINGVNDVPTVGSPVSASESEDAAVFNLDLLSGAEDPDSDTLNVTNLTLESGDATGVTINGNSLEIDPSAYDSLSAGESEIIEYSYDIIDGNGGSVSQTAVITINGADDVTNANPTVSGVVTASESEDAAVFNVDLLQGANDPDGDTLNVTNLSLVSGNAAGITLNGNSVSVDPSAYNSLAVGEDEVITYSYDIVDGNGGSVSQTATITISGENDAPSATNDSDVTDEDTTVNVSIADRLVNDSDPDGDDLTISNVLNAVNGSTLVNADGSVTFTPDADFSGEGSFDYVISDGNGGTDTATVTVTINPIADVPELIIQSPDLSIAPLGDEKQVNTYTSGPQAIPSIASLADGGYIVVWHSDNQDGSGNGVYAQRYDVDGNTVGSEFLVNSFTADDQAYADVVGLDNGGFVIVWESANQDGTPTSVYGQMYDEFGGTVGTEFQINTYTAYSQQGPTISLLSDGGFIVAWQSSSVNDAYDGIFAQRYDVDGNTVGSEFKVSTYSGVYEDRQDVTGLEGGGFVITWEAPLDGSGYGIYARVFDSDGVALASEFQVNTYTASQQNEPVITALVGGGFVVSWTSLDQDGSNEGIFAQIYDSSGTAVGGEFQVNTYTSTYQKNPDITALSDGSFIVTWTSNQDSSAYNIYGQQYDANGNPIGSEFRINTYLTGSQLHPVITGLEDGGFAVAWDSYSQDGSQWGIFSQQFTPGLAENTSVELDISASLTDTDGSESLLISISGMPEGSSFSAGTEQLDGSWVFTTAELSGLIYTPPTGYAGQVDLLIEATATESADGDTATNSEVLSLVYYAVDNFITGDASANVLIGGAGNDELSGLAGNDILIGGEGDDILSGGLDTDTYVYEQGDTGTDTILDFDSTDKLDLSDLLSGDGVTEDAASLDVVLDFNFDGSDTVISIDVGADASTDQTIKLQAVDVTSNNTLSDQEVINNLLGNNGGNDQLDV